MPFTTGEGHLFQFNPRDFDFNVQFEQVFFSIIPSALFIVTSLWRTLWQARKPTVVDAPVFQVIKLTAITTYVGLELSLVVLAAIGSFPVTSLFIASSAVKFVSAVLMISLSFVDHARSPRPSVLLNIYLLSSLLLDVVQARTLFLRSTAQPERTYSSVFVAAVAVKAGILLLEAQHKSKWVRWDEKDHSPEETSGIFSLGVFFWLNKMFLVGYRKVMTMDDLYPLDSSFDAKSLHDKFSKHMNYSKLKGDKFGLVKVLIRTLKVQLLLPIPPRLALVGFKLCQPLFMEKLLDYLSRPELDPNVGYGFIGASILIYMGIAISAAFFWYFHQRMRTMLRSILVTQIFLKATETRVGTANDSAALTLMSTDMERIKMGFRALHDVWASVIQASIASWMLYNRLGLAFIAPVAAVLVCFGGLGILITFTGDSQRTWMAGVQKRVGLTATVISSMKSLKISGLSSAVSDFVQKLRVEELAAGARFRKITIIAAVFAFTPLLMSPPLTFAFTRRTLDASRMFASLSFLTLLTTPLSQIFQSVPEIVSGLACLGRIQSFLECETRQDFRQVLTDIKRNQEGSEKNNTDNGDPFAPAIGDVDPVVVQHGDFGWQADTFVLRDVNTRISKASLTMVVGPVGSGKSTFCKALLGEIPVSKGNVLLSTRFAHVGFCDQTPFLSNGSIKDNIVGFSPLDHRRYAEVVDATCLRFDLNILPQGDGTNVGSDGITLSGGQRQRVSLARALYLQSDLLILDDVFSGLDADTEEQVFRNCFGPDGLLKRRHSTVVLCTHSIRHLSAADYIIALADGTVVEQGTFDKLTAGQGYVQRLRLTNPSDSDASSENTTPMKKAPDLPSQAVKSMADPAAITPNISTLTPDMDQARQVGDRTVYKHYVKSMGLFLAACSVCFAALWGVFTNFPTIWLSYWTADVYSSHPTHSSAYYAGIFALLQICAMLSLLLLGIALFIVSVKRAGASLHRNALNTLIHAPLGFFATTDTGVITNLFSQDLNLIDTELPDATLNTLSCVFQALGQAAVMLTSSVYLAISYPFLIGLLYIVQRFYLRTSRQLRLLDLEAKSPLYTHFLDTLKGIATLRAFGFLPDDIKMNARLIDSSQRPSYLLLMIQEWLSLVLDVVVMVMAVLLTALAVRLHSNSAFAGASLFTLVTFGETLSGIVINYTRLETSIGAVARLRTFNDTVKPEDKEEEDIFPSQQWPDAGVLELKGVSARYDTQRHTDGKTADLALRDIHLIIGSGEKIAICGRTGSGKSSFVALLLKLLDPLPDTAQNAVIDTTPLHRINRSALRERIIAIPQEAVFLPDGSTFRTNIDPAGLALPQECEIVLAIVRLWNSVQDRGGLDAPMSAGSLSAGQRQLLSLGRALLRRRIRARNSGPGSGGSGRGILLLDEVSSSVDYETERVMQEIIRAEFKEYTVVAVSHRLDIIMDFDRVIVMDKGGIVEVGNPAVLAGQTASRFGDLVRAASK